jgi:Uma2 family endonuclease
MSIQLVTRRFTVKEYHQMNQAGILSEDDRVELINGEILEMSPIGTRHATCVRRLINLLVQILGQAAIIDAQNPIILNNFSEPQPDITLLKSRADFYASGHPQPEDILLLIEVADSTIEYDREIKIPLYANHEIAEVWLVDIDQQIITVYCQPSAEGYRKIDKFERGQTLFISYFPDIKIKIEQILG